MQVFGRPWAFIIQTDNLSIWKSHSKRNLRFQAMDLATSNFMTIRVRRQLPDPRNCSMNSNLAYIWWTHRSDHRHLGKLEEPRASKGFQSIRLLPYSRPLSKLGFQLIIAKKHGLLYVPLVSSIRLASFSKSLFIVVHSRRPSK